MKEFGFNSEDASTHKKTHVAAQVIFKTGIVWRIANWGAEAAVYSYFVLLLGVFKNICSCQWPVPLSLTPSPTFRAGS
jgi:hypothetical protein